MTLCYLLKKTVSTGHDDRLTEIGRCYEMEWNVEKIW